MSKQTFVSVILALLLTATTSAQKSKSTKNEQPANSTLQISLEQRLGELSKEISDELTGNQKTTVAIAEFVDLDGKVTSFGKFLAEELVTRLYKTKKLKVIERQRLDKVIAEQKLSLTDIIEASSAKRLGRILGVDAIVTGTISELGNNFRINARIINTETGELLAAAGVSVVKDQEVCSLINCGAQSALINRVETQSSTPKVQPTPIPSSSPRSTSTSIKNDSNFFTFELQKCRLSGTNVICDFMITNNDKDRTLDLATSVMFDDFNNEYYSRRSQLANSQGNRGQAFLVSGVPAKARLTFENVSPNAATMTLLKLTCYVYGDSRRGEKFFIEYRNISLRE